MKMLVIFYKISSMVLRDKRTKRNGLMDACTNRLKQYILHKYSLLGVGGGG